LENTYFSYSTEKKKKKKKRVIHNSGKEVLVPEPEYMEVDVEVKEPNWVAQRSLESREIP